VWVRLCPRKRFLFAAEKPINGIMTFRERVEALPIRPIGHISHGANQSLKIHLLPNAGTDRNVRSFEYLAAPAVDQCIVGQCSLFFAFFKLFFHVAVREDRLIRVINAVLIVVRPPAASACRGAP
jgi:hypothetical protein